MASYLSSVLTSLSSFLLLSGYVYGEYRQTKINSKYIVYQYFICLPEKTYIFFKQVMV